MLAEQYFRGNLEQNQARLARWVRHDLPNGDTIFTSNEPGKPYIPLIVGKGFQKYIPAILQRIDMDFPGVTQEELLTVSDPLINSHFSIVSHEQLLQFGEAPLDVAIKLLKAEPPSGYMSGTQIYTAMRTIEEGGIVLEGDSENLNGIPCVPIVAATPNVLITVWNTDDMPEIARWGSFSEHITTINNSLEELTHSSEAKTKPLEDWHPDWVLEESYENYRKSNQTGLITAIDPVFPSKRIPNLTNPTTK